MARPVLAASRCIESIVAAPLRATGSLREIRASRRWPPRPRPRGGRRRGAIVGRLAHPASERATHRWLQARSGVGELLGVDFETVSAMQVYRASDALVKHREAIEAHLFDKAMGLFDLQPTVTLYDLTNTYFEGEASEQPQAKRGHSKEKRSDCPLLTLGLMLDASGFVRRSKVFAGNVREHRTLAGMLEALQAPAGALVVMDRGVATDACVTWLREHGYRYLVVSRERHRQFDAEAAVAVQTQSKQTVHLHKAVSTDPDEVRLYCYSEERAEKERGIVERFATRFEAALTKLHEGLARPRTGGATSAAPSSLVRAGGSSPRVRADPVGWCAAAR